ncbi:type II toxin-antitoxin system PemK/MazF family toxin [Nocardioides sp. 503]|uniref:type II toxin-antitoxin system PemK/MazF family toxin n=1 Tax=Nocardioides sp. 503 TaxID=2508326 RepID=UPI001FD63988|nr:type II toxin-antitoxin system PemK/MazF family toxin [Nocardioides sp. 503]
MSTARRLMNALRPILMPRASRSTTVPEPTGDRERVDGDRIGYAPRADGLPDPGEVVWAWVPYEEDASQGKDRPALLIGRRGDRLLALMLTSKDHDRDAEDEARHGRHWMDVGSGAWDREGRPSEVRLDRLLVLDPASVRREGAALDRGVFDAVVSAAARFHPTA